MKSTRSCERSSSRRACKEKKTSLKLTDSEVGGIAASLPSVSEGEKKRVELLIRIYRLINQKYHLGFQEIRYHLQEASRWGFEGLDELQKVLDRNDTLECLEAILTYLEGLKEIIISPERFRSPGRYLSTSGTSPWTFPPCTAGTGRRSSMPWD